MSPEFLLPVPIAIVGVCFFDLARTLLVKDQLLKRLHADHHDVWVKMGKPTGWLWQPKGYLPHGFAAANFSFESLRKQRPSWIQKAPELIELFERVRKGGRRWIFLGLPLSLGSVGLFMLIAWLLSNH